MIKDDINKIKIDMGIIDAVDIYNTESKLYIYKEINESPLLESVVELNCFDKISCFYLDFAKDSFFCLMLNNNVVLAKLKKGRPYNKVLLELSCQKLVKLL